MSSNSSTWGFAYVNAYDGAQSANLSQYRIWYSSNVSRPSLGGFYSDCLFPGQHQHIFVPAADVNKNGTLDMNIRAISCYDSTVVRTTTFELFASGIDIFILFRNSTGGVKFWDFGFFSNEFANVGAFNAIYDGNQRSHKFNVGSSISSCQITDGSNFANCAYKSFIVPQTLSSGTLLTACDSITTDSCISSVISGETTVAVGETLWAIAMSSGFIYFKTPYRADSTSTSLSISSSTTSSMPVGTALSYFGIAVGGFVALCFLSCFFYRKKNGGSFMPMWDGADNRDAVAQSNLPVETVRRQQNPALELHGINSFDMETVGTDAGITTSSAVGSSSGGGTGNHSSRSFNSKKYTGRAKYVPTDRRTRLAGAGAGGGNPGGSNRPVNPPIAEEKDDEESDLDGRGAAPLFVRTNRNI